MEKPLVSVLMTAYNREKFIAEAIESVLASSYPNFELIILDDCSSDNTVAIARSFEEKDRRIKVYVNEKNLGDYPNRNKIATYASGAYIKYVDSDDLIYPQGLETMVESMERYPEAGVGIVAREPEKSEDMPMLLNPSEAYYSSFFEVGMFDMGPTGLIFKTDKFRQVGGFSGKRLVGDIEINLRMAAKWPVVKMARELVYWRKHPEQEYEIGLLTTGYLEAMLPMYQDELNKPECPLTEEQRKLVLGYYRKMSARKILKMVLLERKPSAALKVYKTLGLRVRDLFNSVFFMEKNKH